MRLPASRKNHGGLCTSEGDHRIVPERFAHFETSTRH